jgi:hypothetical protein
MLPGLRFLVAAIVLSMSLLVFGLGAAALLRAAHEEFASNPSWRTAPEVSFGQPAEPTNSVLAALRVELPPAATPHDLAPATAAQTEEAAVAPAATSAASSEPIAEQQSEEASLPQPARSQASTMEIPAAENVPAAEPAPVSAEKPAAELQIAAVATGKISTPAVAEPQATIATEQIAVPPLPVTESLTTKIATLGGPAMNIESPPKAKIGAAKTDSAKADQSGKRARAKEASRRKIAAARAKLAAQQAQQVQQPPFLLQPDPLLQQPAQAARPRKVKKNHPGPVATAGPST